MTDTMSKYLPASLGTLFGQPLERAPQRASASPPSTIAGAYAAPELCQLIEGYRADLLPRDAIAEVKVDGIRCLYIGGKLVSREGTPFDAAAGPCLDFLREIERAYGKPMMFDGEYIEEGGLEATIAAFRSRKGDGCLWLFDAVPLDEWQSGKPSRQILAARKAGLRRALETAANGRRGNPVGIINEMPMANDTDVQLQARRVWALGMEGLVIKSASSRYMRKRNCDWMKVKLLTVSDMVVVDVLGCKRDGEDSARSLLVRLPHSPPTRASGVPVHGGLARTIWGERNNLVGTLVKVEHQGFTSGGCPREPVLKQFTM